MANNLKDISAYYNEMYGGALWGVAVQINRSNGLPLDQSTIFQTYEAALSYAQGNAVSSYSPDGTLLVQKAAYRGQYIAVVPINGATSAFIVNNDGGLTQLASGGSTDEIISALCAEISARIEDDEYLSTTLSIRIDSAELSIDRISNTVVLSVGNIEDEIKSLSNDVKLSVGNLESSLSVTVEKQATAESTYFATYVVKQGGQQVGEKINIPKDFLVKSAKVYTCSADNDPPGVDPQLVKGDKYIDFVINTKEGTGQGDEHLYINLKGLMDIYTGATTDTIKVQVGTDNKISAEVNQFSIDFDHITDPLSAYIKQIRTDVDTVSTDLSVVSCDLSVVSIDLSTEIIERQSADYDLSGILSAYSEEVAISSGLSAYLSAKTYVDNAIDGLDSTLTAGQDQKRQKVFSKIAINDGKLDEVNSETILLKINDINGLSAKLTSVVEEAKDYTDSEIGKLSYTNTLNSTDRISAVIQTNGKLSVMTETFQMDNVSNWQYTLDARYRKKEDSFDKPATSSLISAIVEGAIDELDVDPITSTVSATLTSVSETNGKITASYSPIKISEDQVTNLTSDLSTISDDISALSDAIDAIGKGSLSNYMLLSTFNDISTTIGLDRASSYDKVAISSDVSSTVSAAISALRWNIEATTYGQDKTIEVITQEDGQISVVAQDIQIKESQVTQLTDDLDFLSGTLSVVSSDLCELSGSVATISADHETRITANEDAIKLLSSATHFRGTLTEAEIPLSAKSSELSVEYGLVNKFKPCEKGDIAIYVTDSTEYIYASDLSAETSGWVKLGDEGTYLKKSEYYVDKAKVELSVAGLSSGLAQEILDRKANDTFLSNAINNKITVDGVKPTDLSVQHISQADYHALVVAGTALSNCIYIVSSDNYDMYGQQIKNLAEATDLSDAVPKHQAESIAATAASNLSASLSAIQQIKLNDNLFDVEYVNGKLVASLSITLIDGNF